MNDKRGLIAYFVIAFTFTWSLHFAIRLLDVPFALDLSNPGMSLYLAGLGGPLLAAVVVSGLASGSKGIRSLLAAGLKWRFPLRWYLAAILTLPGINLLNIAVFHNRLPEDFAWFVVVPMLILGQVWVVIAEEYGWRGYALPRLQGIFGSLGATLILGPVWALWHLPMFFVEGSPQYSDNVPLALTFYAVIIFFFSLILTMLYNRTGGSVLACMLFHASLNIAAFTIRVPPDVKITMILVAATALISIWFMDRPLFGKAKAPG